MNHPFPGSTEAREAGCKCPVLDNAHGHGAYGTQDLPNAEKLWWVNQGCPLHGVRAVAK